MPFDVVGPGFEANMCILREAPYEAVKASGVVGARYARDVLANSASQLVDRQQVVAAAVVTTVTLTSRAIPAIIIP
jgi:hypothetical protein